MWEEREEEENGVIRVESVQNRFPAKQRGQNKLECQSALVCARSSKNSSGSNKVKVI